MNVIVDTHETKLFDIMNKMMVEEPTRSFTIISKPLIIGDIHIVDNTGKVLIIFERKTVADLASSISDGRYNEQSFRLNESPVHNHNIHYIVEGNIESYKSRSHINKKAIYSSLLSLSYYKGFSVLKTISCEDTANIILRFTDKICKEGSKKTYYEKDLVQGDYIDTLKITKKQMVTKDNITKLMLIQIPSVSINIANVITEKYSTIIDLICDLQDDNTCLNNMTYKNSSGKMVKISKPSIKNIIEFLSIT
jgi:ERCC4-type nuclease